MTDDEMRTQIAAETAGLSGAVLLLEHPTYCRSGRVWFGSLAEFSVYCAECFGESAPSLTRVDADLSVLAEFERLLPRGASVTGEWVGEEEETVLVEITLP